MIYDSLRGFASGSQRRSEGVQYMYSSWTVRSGAHPAVEDKFESDVNCFAIVRPSARQRAA